MPRVISIFLSVATITLLLFLTGCDDDPVIPNPDSGIGTIVIRALPHSKITPWTISGPASFTKNGVGDTTLIEMKAGEYTLTWGLVDHWIKPASMSKPLVSDGAIIFSGTYELNWIPYLGFVQIPPDSIPMPSTFIMGSALVSDGPPRQVTLTKRFSMSASEVTNAQYVAAVQWAYDRGYVTTTDFKVFDTIDGSTAELLYLDPFFGKINFSDGIFGTPEPNLPVVNISWFGAAAYCDWLSMQESLPRAYDHSTWRCNGSSPYLATGYRLPTEAEWEFACRAGTTSPFNTGACLNTFTEANYNGNSPYSGCLAGHWLNESTDVGQYLPNGWWLYDIHGNTSEWCNDWYGEYSGLQTDPKGPEDGTARVVRGGDFYFGAERCRSAHRHLRVPGAYVALEDLGFRPVKSIH